MPVWVYFLIFAVLVGFFILGIYNGMVKARNMTDESWSGVDVQLKRRRDLIPNLVSTVQAYAAHERQAMDSVTDARAIAESASHAGARQAAPAENKLTLALGGLFAVSENYPDLKANQNFLQLQQELTNVETNVAGARVIFNENARKYNDRIQAFPGNVFASPFGFKSRPYFEATIGERAPASVGF
jgi:LemA protein